MKSKLVKLYRLTYDSFNHEYKERWDYDDYSYIDREAISDVGIEAYCEGRGTEQCKVVEYVLVAYRTRLEYKPAFVHRATTDPESHGEIKHYSHDAIGELGRFKTKLEAEKALAKFVSIIDLMPTNLRNGLEQNG